MITFSVIILLWISIAQDVTCSQFRMYRHSRSLSTSDFSPQSPCPSVFQYQNDQSGNLIGAIKVDQSDQQGKVQLDVELSIENSSQGYNGIITLVDERNKVKNHTTNRKPIFYSVQFPTWQNFPPKVTRIVVNGNQICSDQRIPIQKVPVLTTISLQHKMSLKITPLISSSDSSVNSSTYDNLVDLFSSQGNQQTNTQYPLDDRVKNLSTVQNNILTDNSNSSSSSNIFPNNNNSNNFNSQSSDDHPSPDHHPPPNNRRPTRDTRHPPHDTHHLLHDTHRPDTPEPQVPGPTGEDMQIGGNNLQTTTPKNRNPNYNDICGRSTATNPLIVGGQSVARGAHPWLVAIFRQQESLGLGYICSGSLISDRHVVTAAHCFIVEHRLVKPSECVCFFGKLNLRNWLTTPEEIILEPESIMVHHDYKIGKVNGDIAVMTFKDLIPFNKMIRPVCLWQGSNDLTQAVGDIGTVVGWGRNENGDLSTAEPKQVRTSIVDEMFCLRGSSSSGGQDLVESASKNTFCADFIGGSGPCKDVSGFGLLQKKNGTFYLRGIVTTREDTNKLCNLQEYVVFTDVIKYLDWLMSILNQS